MSERLPDICPFPTGQKGQKAQKAPPPLVDPNVVRELGQVYACDDVIISRNVVSKA